MWIFEPESFRFIYVNTTAIQQYGYTQEEFQAMTIFDIRPPDEHGRLQSVLDTEKKERHTYARGNWKHRKKSGEIITVEIFSQKIMFDRREAMLVLANDVTRSIELQEQLDRERNVREQEILRATVDMQEKARKEISYELHDNVNQLLGAARLYLETGTPGQPLAEEHRQESRAIIQTAIEEIRRLTRS
jgi:PAS domain S-box-containing protein